MFEHELMKLIANGENSGVEFKRDDVRPEQVAKEVVAFANLKGGRILLGVDDDKNIVGLTRRNVSEWVTDTVFGRYVHPLILPYYEEVVMGDGKRVAVVTVGSEISKPYVVRENDRETAYIRIGNVSRPATREQLLMLGSSGGIVHSEVMPVHGTDFASLDLVRLENYMRGILSDPQVPQNRKSWIERLKALGLMADGPVGEPVCTIAGLILFGVKPRQYFRQSGVRLMVFDSPDKIYRARLDKILDAPLVGRFSVGKTVRNLIDAGLIEKTLDLLEPFIAEEANSLNGKPSRDRIWLYPFEALRELLINALAHRDWTRFTDVEVAAYLDRIEITSPGALPNSMTVEKMMAGQRSARNHIIVGVLRDYGYVDARGMGVRVKVIPSLEARDARYTYEETDDYVKITVGKTSGKGEKTSGKHDENVGKRRKNVGKDTRRVSGKKLDNHSGTRVARWHNGAIRRAKYTEITARWVAQTRRRQEGRILGGRVSY
jgi:ATP-dependent DNA helicase RecG